MNDDPLVTAEVIAELLWSRSPGFSNMPAGTIPHYKLGRYVRFRVSEVLAWVEECRAGGRVTRLAD